MLNYSKLHSKSCDDLYQSVGDCYVIVLTHADELEKKQLTCPCAIVGARAAIDRLVLARVLTPALAFGRRRTNGDLIGSRRPSGKCKAGFSNASELPLFIRHRFA